ncbi:filamentous hemagglutinin N-terminal domain-containing protein, partial [Salmonella enterica subsp. enterica serovar Panama]|nr:filamentous hemagglutinin N-terminal domain-containing protein [Salmonella enterica subsp. enterica serovar Panama]
MNRIYKLKFDKRRNELVIVSEITAGAGKEKSTGHIADLTALSPFRKLLGTLTPVALLTGLIAGLLPAMVLAADLPAGGQIVGGQGSISTSGNQMTIHQQTQNMATNWHSFDIGKNNTVQFVQPDSSSVALNRVTGASGSQIMGNLKANGQVFILNPNGVLFGKDARVNVGGLVASTKNLSTADFMKGQYTLSGSGNPGAQVVNQGSLTTAKGGYIVLAGERVSNSGTVTTPSGKAVLAAGKTVTLQLDNGGLTSVSVNGSVVNALVENRGLISATNGQVYLTAKGQDMLLNTVVNNIGTVEAKGLASRGGEIVLNGGDSGVVSQSGQLLADSQTGQGGKITLEGQNIHLTGGSLTSATGKTGGGEVYVGGGWQGQDSHIKNASKVVMDKTATVDVSATENGNGGTAVLWSDDYTNFRGTVLAKGGAQSGDGGRVETSSRNNLQAFGSVDASARAGRGGEWLLDPTDVMIVSDTANTGVAESGKGTDASLDTDTEHVFSPLASGAKVSAGKISDQLNAGTNVTIRTSGADTAGQTGNITLSANAKITKTAGGDATLTLQADNGITLAGGAKIESTAGALNLSLLAGNTTNNAVIVMGGWSGVLLNGGDFYAGPGKDGNNISMSITDGGSVAGKNIQLNVTRGLSGVSLKLNATGDLTINGPVSAMSGDGNWAQFLSGGQLTINSPGDISLPGVGDFPDSKIVLRGDKRVSLTAAGDVRLVKAGNNGTFTCVTSSAGGVSIASGGNLTLTNVNVASGGGRDVTLLAAGSRTGMVNVRGGTLSSNGGNITVDQLNHTSTGVDGNAVTNPNAMTIKVSGSTLNAAVPGNSVVGDVVLRAYNPNVNLSQAAYTSTVRNAGAALEIGGVSHLSGRDIIAESYQDGTNSKSLPVFVNGATLTAERDITLRGIASKSATPASLELRGSGNTLTATQGNITLENTNSTIFLNGVTSDKVKLTAFNGNINITGLVESGSKDSIDIINTEISANKKGVNITGHAANGAGSAGIAFLGGNVISASEGSIVVSGITGGVDPDSGPFLPWGGIFFKGKNSFTTPVGVITGESNKKHANYDFAAGIAFGESGWGDPPDLEFNGAFTIKAISSDASNVNYAAYISEGTKLNFKNGHSSLLAQQSGRGDAIYYVLRPTSNNTFFVINLDKADLDFSAYANNGAALSSGQHSTKNSQSSGIVFSGKGNVTMHFENKDNSNATLNANLINNKDLDGALNITAVNNGNGAGVYAGGMVNISLSSANVTGSSKGTGQGVLLDVSNSNATSLMLAGSNFEGTTSNGSEGIKIKAGSKPLVITGGSVSGASESGGGKGVSFVSSGAGEITLNGTTVMGKSVDGAAVDVAGNLSVNKVTIEGNSTGSGIGVSVSGDLKSDEGVSITGYSNTGGGVLTSGITKLNNATVKGSSESGSGVILSAGTSVSEGALEAVSVSGTGLQVEKGGSVENVVVSAQTVTGQAIGGDKGALTTAGSTSISIVGNAGSAAVIAENVKPVPGVPIEAISDVLLSNIK